MTATGLAIGLSGAVLGNRLMQSIVFGVSPSSPGVLVTVAVLVGIVTYAACYVPVSRATRIDPIIVLRQDSGDLGFQLRINVIGDGERTGSSSVWLTRNLPSDETSKEPKGLTARV